MAQTPTAASGGGDMKAQAQEKAKGAASQAQEKLREQINQRSTQAGEQIDSTAQDLRTVGEELRKQDKETPAKLADQAADRVEQVGGYLRDSDADRILSDIEDFGRERPWAVLAGGVVLGVAAARFLKASSSGRYQARQGAMPSGRPAIPPVPPPATPPAEREVPSRTR